MAKKSASEEYKTPKELEVKTTDAELIKIYKTYKAESMQARHDRIQQNRLNFDAYHLRQDWSYKQRGQSQEFLPKMSMAVEQGSSFLQQGLIDLGDWFKVDRAPGVIEDAMNVKPSEIQRLLQRQLELNDFYATVGNAAKLGFIGSLMIAKVTGKWVPKPKYKVETKLTRQNTYAKKLIKIEDKAWRLQVDLVRQQDFFPDPTGRGLYRMQDIYLDYFEVEKLAKGKNAIYDLEAVKQLRGEPASEGAMRYYDKARETGQNIANAKYRSVIKLTEIWGTFVDPNGDVLFENCVCTIGNDRIVLQPPTENPFWHGEDPFVAVPIITVPHGVWGKALMDAPAMLNKAINEMFNLMLDGGLMSVHGIKQIREDWLSDASQVEDGISAGDTLRVNTSCPPGATVLENVMTSSVPQDGIAMYNLLNQEHNSAALTNDLRMGVQPFRAVKATEVVEASQSITSMFNGIAKHFETNFIAKILDKSWKTCAQHMDDLDSNELKALLGEKRAAAIAALGPEELFADTVQGHSFNVFGVSAILNKQKDFSKIQALMQTIASSPVLMESFTKEYDFTKLLSEIMKSLDLDPSKLAHDDGPDQAPAAPQQAMPAGGLPNAQSQIPQAGAAGNQTDQTMDAIPQTQFPASRATPAGSQGGGQ